ncbi:MAG: putative monovalent cation/H+ antiporter subunit A [Candidatus Krumholzibacteriia bacterium]
MLWSILLLLVTALAAPWVHRAAPRLGGWLLAAAPFAVFGWLVAHVPAIDLREVFLEDVAWAPQLGVDLALRLDGLSLLMGLLITGVGGFIVIYAGGYLHGHPQLGRFYLFLLAFLASMLGVVLADDVILLFVFWELTSITSYLLIGFNHEEQLSRWNALQALLVTGLGGMALLAGLILLAAAAGTTRLGEILAGGSVADHALYPAIFVLIALGCFTKSAQVPFHFWLPNAMVAPTPVSAFLHSATMVKAGIYLLARLLPVLGGTVAWTATLAVVGALTMLLGAALALFQTDLKRLLAYTTLSVLGLLTMLLGVGSDLAVKSALMFLLGHALYKATLFMTAGSVDHETGTRDVTMLRGLRRAMPWTAGAAALAALSKAGFPPLLGFLGKESIYETGLRLDDFGSTLIAVSMAANMLLLALAFKAGLHPFWGHPREARLPRAPHEAPPSMWVGPLVLAVAGLLFGLAPKLVARPLIQPAAAAVTGGWFDLKLALWHGINVPLMLSLITVIGGLAIYAVRERLWAHAGTVAGWTRFGTEAGYERIYDGVMAFARWQTRLLQSGYLHRYIRVVLGAVLSLLAWKLVRFGGLPAQVDVSDLRLPVALLVVVMAAATLVAATARSRLQALVALGLVGYGMALLYVYFGAPDLAITQLLVETLTVVLFAAVALRLPDFGSYSSRRAVLRDAVFAVGAGLLVAALVVKSVHVELAPTISGTLVDWSYPLGKGRNVVNVILVDFRALDTLGEITVLTIAALGVTALLAGLRRKGGGA